MTRWVQKIQTLSGTTTYLWSPEIAARIGAGDLGIAEIKAYIAYLESENHCLNRELGKYKRLWQACCRTEVINSKKVGMSNE